MPKKRIAQAFGVSQLCREFPDEDARWSWLEEVLWNGEPICPHCGYVEDIKPPPSKPRHYWCKSCRKHFTATTGAALHSRRRPLRDWVYAIYSALTARKGVSAMQISKELDCHYRTAWYMLHRTREACGRGGFVLSEVVEADETYIGGKESAKHADKKLKAGRGAGGKVPVMGMRARGGRLKAMPVARTNKKTLQGAIEENVMPGSTVYTDEHGGLGQSYKHESVKHSLKEYVNGLRHVNGIESVWAVLKRSVHDTWDHASPKHLARYVNEASFRLNEGNCEVDTLDRMATLARKITGDRLSFQQLTADNGLSSVVQS